MNLTCSKCQAENLLCEHVSKGLKDLVHERGAMLAELKVLANTWKGILKVMDLQNANAGNIFLKIPKIISQVKRKPELFNFIDPEINQIIDKYAEK